MKSMRTLNSIVAACLLITASSANAQYDSENIDWSRVLSWPTQRVSWRAQLADYNNQYHTAYVGQMHSHTRGHGSPSAAIAARWVLGSAFWSGYDFFVRSNHWSSFQDGSNPLESAYDTSHGHFEYYPWKYTDQPYMFVIHGLESHLDAYQDNGQHQAHYNVYNQWKGLYGAKIEDLIDTHVGEYRADPVTSVHLQLNHPSVQSNWAFRIPSGLDATKRQNFIDMTDVAEISNEGSVIENLGTYLQLLVEGWKVAPIAQYDFHAKNGLSTEEQEKNPDGSYKQPWLEMPGIAPGRLRDANHPEQTNGTDSDTWSGMVLPTGATIENLDETKFFTGLRNRKTFQSNLQGGVALAFGVGGGLPGQALMGSTIRLPDNTVPFNFYASAQILTGIGSQESHFTEAQIWAPHRSTSSPLKRTPISNPDRPKAISRFDVGAVTLYEPVYLVRLQGHTTDRNIVTAPFWVENPTERPGNLAFVTPAVRGLQELRWTGGGRRMKIQTSGLPQVGGAPQWLDFAMVTDLSRKFVFNSTLTPVRSAWRVVDADDPYYASNAAELVLPGGPLVRKPSTGQIFVEHGGALFYIPGPDWFSRLELDPAMVRDVPDQWFDGRGNIPGNGSLLTAETGGDGKVYYIESGSKYHLPSPQEAAALGIDLSRTRRVPSADLARLPTSPKGHVESVMSDGRVKGWAFDIDSLQTPTRIHVYVDGPAGSGMFGSEGLANIYRSDVNSAYGIVGNHGFVIKLPDCAFDQKTHSVYVYAIDSGGGYNPWLDARRYTFRSTLNLYPPEPCMTP